MLEHPKGPVVPPTQLSESRVAARKVNGTTLAQQIAAFARNFWSADASTIAANDDGSSPITSGSARYVSDLVAGGTPLTQPQAGETTYNPTLTTNRSGAAILEFDGIENRLVASGINLTNGLRVFVLMDGLDETFGTILSSTFRAGGDYILYSTGTSNIPRYVGGNYFVDGVETANRGELLAAIQNQGPVIFEARNALFGTPAGNRASWTDLGVFTWSSTNVQKGHLYDLIIVADSVLAEDADRLTMIYDYFATRAGTAAFP